MTAPDKKQLTFDELCDLGAQQLYPEPEPRDRDLHGQGLTAIQLHTITDVELAGRWL